MCLVERVLAILGCASPAQPYFPLACWVTACALLESCWVQAGGSIYLVTVNSKLV